MSAEAAVAPGAFAGAFEHHHAAHCESGVASALLRHHGLPLSEAMAFGVSSALSFAYLPFIRVNGLPLISYRMPPKFILKGVQRALGWRFRFETFRDPVLGESRLNELLDAGQPVGMQTSVFWLPYFPSDMRFHFNAHNVLAVGRSEGGYRLSDPVFEQMVDCPAADLRRARFARGVLAPHGLLYYPVTVNRSPDLAKACRNAIKRTTRIMLSTPLPLIGVRGIGRVARRVAALAGDADRDHALRYIGHIVRMQEEIGTGGGGFRFIYASFLQEAAALTASPALDECAAKMTAIGDRWREFALAAARIVRGRDPFEPARLAQLLHGLADSEAALYRELRKAV